MSHQRAGNLPAEVTSFVGRHDELRDAEELLARGVRHVTLTGTGGVGKTRLAIKVGRRAAERGTYSHGVWLVALSGLQDPDLLALQIAESLGLVDNSFDIDVEAATTRLINALRERRLLLILDNCEHLLPATRRLVRRLLEECQDLAVLTTSQERLKLHSEHTIRLQPMVVGTEYLPGDLPADEKYCPAVQLFLDRAVATGDLVTHEDIPVVMEVCRLLDGLPLSIELAAARFGEMSITDFRDQLAKRPEGLGQTDGRFGLLVDGDPTGKRAHQSLLWTLEWSVARCSPAEQLLLARLSVFPDEFGRAAVESVCAGNGIDREEVQDLLSGLVNKSLLITKTGRFTRRTRYRLLGTIAQFGSRALGDDGTRRELHQAHADYYRDALREATSDWFGPDEVKYLGEMREEWTNLRVAISFYGSQPGQTATSAEMAAALAQSRVGVFAGLLAQTRHLLEQAIRAHDDEPTPALLAALLNFAWIALVLGEGTMVTPTLRRARTMAKQLGAEDSGPVLFVEGTYLKLAEPDQMRARGCIDMLTRSLEASQRSSPPGETHMVLLFLGISSCFYGDRAIADDASARVLDSATAQNAKWAISWGLWTRGLFEFLHGDPRDGYRLVQQSLAMQYRMGDTWGPVWGTWLLACIAAALGVGELSAVLFGASERQRQDCRVVMSGLFPWSYLQKQAYTRVQRVLGGAFSEHFARGREMRSQQLSVATLEELPEVELRWGVEGDTVLPGGVSVREYEVAGLVAEGLSSKKIGDRLHISPRTVDRHVDNARVKLRLGNRAELGSWFTQQRAHASASGG